MTTGNKNRTTLELRDYSGVTGTGLLLLLELQDYSRVAGPTGTAAKTTGTAGITGPTSTT